MAVVEAAGGLRDADDRTAQHVLRITHGPGKRTSEIGGKIRIAIIGEIAANAALCIVVSHDVVSGNERLSYVHRSFTPTGDFMRILSAMMLLGLLGAAYAESLTQDFPGSRIRIDARATEQVTNDVMRAMLFVEMEDADAGKLAQRTNNATNDA